MSTSSVIVPTDSFHYQKRWIGLIFIGISVIVISIDNTILNVALPSIARDLNASTTDLQWIVDGYVLVFAALLLTMGTVSDRIGRKRALQIGLMLFSIASISAALSQTTGALIAARMFRGIAAALMLPATLSIISATFQPHERPQAIALWASLFGLGVGIGPVIGGFLVQNFGWHSVFLVSLPVIVLALIGGQIYLGETKESNPPPLDIVGSLLSVVGLFALIYGIVEAGVIGWGASQVVVSLAVAAVTLLVFALWEARTPYPMLPLRFFKNPAFTGANITLTLLSFSLFGAVFYTSQYLQSVLGYPAFTAGLLLLPLAITMTIVTARSAKAAQRLGTKRTVALGVAIAGTSFLYQSLVYDINTSYFPWILIAQLLQATGVGLATSPATTAVMSSIPVEKAGVGSAMNDTTRQLGGALGVAVLGAIGTSIYLTGVAPLQNVLPTDVYANVAAGLQTAVSPATLAQLPPDMIETVTLTARAAFVDGMTRAFLISSIAIYTSSLFALAVLPDVVKRPRVNREAAEPEEEVAVTPH